MTSPTRRSFAGPILLLLTGVVGVFVSASPYAQVAGVDELGELVSNESNRPFFTWIVFSAVLYALLAAGIAAVGRDLGSLRGGELGAAAGATAAAGAGALCIGPVVLSGIVNRWTGVFSAEVTDVVAMLDAFRFGSSQVGWSIVALALILLACTGFVGRGGLGVGVVALFSGLILFALVAEGSAMIPFIAPTLLAFALGAMALVSPILQRVAARKTPSAEA